MDLKRMLQTARTSDLYDVIAEALNVLAERDADLITGEGILARYADLERDGKKFGFVYHDDDSITAAELERDGRGGA
jgi:hypothetical protein